MVERPLSDGAASATAGSQRDDACGSQWPNVRPSQRPSRKRSEYWTYLKGPMPSGGDAACRRGRGERIAWAGPRAKQHCVRLESMSGRGSFKRGTKPCSPPAGCCNAAAPT